MTLQKTEINGKFVPLGRGINGLVYQGTLGKKSVAIKTIEASDLGNKREEVLRFLNHPNVVKLLFVEDNERIVTENNK